MKNNPSSTPAGSAAGYTFLKLLVFVIIFGCVVMAAWVHFLPHVLTSTLQKRTRFGVKVTELKMNPFTAQVEMTGFVLTNPESFPRPDFIEVSSFSAKGNLASFFSERPEFEYARIDVASVALVRDSSGVLNAQLFGERLKKRTVDHEPPIEAVATDELKKDRPNDAPATKGTEVKVKPKQDKKADPKEAAKGKNTEPAAKDKKEASAEKKGKQDKAKVEKEAPKPEEPPMLFLIKRLEVRLDKLIVADYTQPTPEVREYNCKLSYAFNDVTDPKQLVAPFAFKSLQSVGTALKALIPGSIGRAMGAATQSQDPMIKPKDAQAEDPIKSVVEKLEETQKP